MDVEYLSEVHIERAANELLTAYCVRFEHPVAPPVPAEEILECQLGLSLAFADLRGRFGQSDILGAIWVEDGAVVIDESLDPDECPGQEGRYRFTVAHEVGHWALHRHQFIAAGKAGLFTEEKAPSVVCRDQPRSGKPRIEWQADAFASHLLMPEPLIRRSWAEVHGCPEPYVATGEWANRRARFGAREDEYPTVEVAHRMATVFKVSGQAMQIRLLALGLILEKQPPASLFG